MSSGAPPATETKETASVQAQMVGYGLFGSIAQILFSVGAAKLSYDKFQSVGWAFLAAIFSWFYYPYYAFFLSTPASASMVAAGRRLHKW
jgi:hypothetical protein